MEQNSRIRLHIPSALVQVLLVHRICARVTKLSLCPQIVHPTIHLVLINKTKRSYISNGQEDRVRTQELSQTGLPTRWLVLPTDRPITLGPSNDAITRGLLSVHPTHLLVGWHVGRRTIKLISIVYEVLSPACFGMKAETSRPLLLPLANTCAAGLG
jgi:hypothetical protein